MTTKKFCVRCGQEGHLSHECKKKIFNSVLLGLALIALGGCATTGGPEIVKVPVTVPCKVEDPVQPQYRYQPPYDNIFDAVRDMLGDRELANAYENELRIALKACK